MHTIKLILDAFRGIILCSQEYGFIITIFLMVGGFT